MDNMIQAFWRNSRYAKSVHKMDFHLLDFTQQQRQIAVGNPMILPLHPRVAALFFQPKRNREDQSEDHQRRYQQHGMCNNGQHQSDLQSPHHNTTPFIRGWAVTNSRADILFRLPLGTFYHDAFPALVLRREPKVNGSTNCCHWQISGLCIDNCDRKEAYVQL